MINVRCPNCNKKIADYSGMAGYNIPVQSKYYTRVDGSQPVHGSKTSHKCPHCDAPINELEATMGAIALHLENGNAETVGNDNT